MPKRKQQCPWKSILAEGQERSPRSKRSHGYVIDSQGIHVDPTKTEAVKNWASPTTPTEKELNMRQHRWLELLVDYDWKIHYHPGKENVIADALSQKERIKPLRVRALVMTYT
nr:reverse transcriptase domain-containing protein [Tanacetum cinerariifolium]